MTRRRAKVKILNWLWTNLVVVPFFFRTHLFLVVRLFFLLMWLWVLSFSLPLARWRRVVWGVITERGLPLLPDAFNQHAKKDGKVEPQAHFVSDGWVVLEDMLKALNGSESGSGLVVKSQRCCLVCLCELSQKNNVTFTFYLLVTM